jgi:hypothetical protein
MGIGGRATPQRARKRRSGYCSRAHLLMNFSPVFSRL